MPEINYGKSGHYPWDNGATYFELQHTICLKTATVDARNFSIHVGKADIVLDFGCGVDSSSTSAVSAEQGIKPYPYCDF